MSYIYYQPLKYRKKKKKCMNHSKQLVCQLLKESLIVTQAFSENCQNYIYPFIYIYFDIDIFI